jgi:hypothetical protein
LTTSGCIDLDNSPEQRLNEHQFGAYSDQFVVGPVFFAGIVAGLPQRPCGQMGLEQDLFSNFSFDNVAADLV